MKLLLAFVALIVITSCAVFENPSYCVDRHGDGICWLKNPVQIPVTTVKWETEDNHVVLARCGYEVYTANGSCMEARIKETGVCWVLSAYTEKRARKTAAQAFNMNTAAARSVYQHEVEDHCGIGPNGELLTQWVHPNHSITPAGQRR